jgi:sugar phosphate permease
MGVGYLLLSQVHSYATFLIVYLGVISLAHAGGFMHAPMVLINTWFIRHRARAITISSAAFGLGGVLVAPVLSIIVQTLGWRWGAAIGGVLFLVIGLPLCLTIRRSPESMGLLPDGNEATTLAAGQGGANQTIKSEVEVTLAEALRSFAFWGSVLAAGIRNGSYHAISVHFVPLMVWKGLSQSEAALLLSVYAFLGMAATLILGWLADKANKPRMKHSSYLPRPGRCFYPLSAAPSGRCFYLLSFLPRWRLLFRLAGPWSAICLAVSTTPRFAAIWSCFILGGELSVR